MPALKTACMVKKAMKKSRKPPMRRMNLQAMRTKLLHKRDTLHRGMSASPACLWPVYDRDRAKAQAQMPGATWELDRRIAQRLDARHNELAPSKEGLGMDTKGVSEEAATRLT